MENLNAQELLQTIKENGNPDKAPLHKKYHKSELIFYGWDTPDLRKLAVSAAGQIKDNDTLFIFAAFLWASEIWEARMLCEYILAKRLDLFMEEDFTRFYKWLRDCDGWAVTDMLAYPVLGEYLRRFPQFVPQVDRWKRTIICGCAGPDWFALLPPSGTKNPGRKIWNRFFAIILRKKIFLSARPSAGCCANGVGCTRSGCCNFVNGTKIKWPRSAIARPYEILKNNIFSDSAKHREALH